ncbi:hypothetical protein T484DRAFT_2185782 [Baffinella frigidus]|nr:hypothetical protein T484DRAFT_2185782 [Cryptophyta sp. CCMP2293]
MEEVAGYKFIDRLFTRQDCKDGHPYFISRKNLQMVVDTLKREDAKLGEWVSVDNAQVMFDDDGGVLAGGEQLRLIRVPAYDYWEPCPWDTRVTQDVLSKNTDEAADLVRRSVVEWGIARPSFAKEEEDITIEDRAKDDKWLEHRKKKEMIQLSYNKVPPAPLEAARGGILNVGLFKFVPVTGGLGHVPARIRAGTKSSRLLQPQP